MSKPTCVDCGERVSRPEYARCNDCHKTHSGVPEERRCMIDGRQPAPYAARVGTGWWCRACYEWSRKRDWADPTSRKRHQTARPGATCSLDQCDKPHKALGYCEEHYGQHKTHGDPTVRVKRPDELYAELRAAAYATTNDCFGLSGRPGRPTVGLNGKTMNASRAVWIVRYGDPGKRYVLHTCNGGSGKHGCINIRHLYLGNAKRNSRDMVIGGHSTRGQTFNRGANIGNALLDDDKAREVLKRYVPGRPYHPGNRAALAAEFGVKEGTIKDVVLRRRWKHV